MKQRMMIIGLSVVLGLFFNGAVFAQGPAGSGKGYAGQDTMRVVDENQQPGDIVNELELPGTANRAGVENIGDQTQTRDQNRTMEQTRDQIREQSREQIMDQTRDQIMDQTRDQLMDQTKDQIMDQTRDKIVDQAEQKAGGNGNGNR